MSSSSTACRRRSGGRSPWRPWLRMKSWNPLASNFAPFGSARGCLMCLRGAPGTRDSILESPQLFELPQRALLVGEVGGVQHLKARVVLAIERSHTGRAPGVLRIRRRIEPQAQVIHLDGVGSGVHARIRKGSVE